jgi:hypothetical protein
VILTWIILLLPVVALWWLVFIKSKKRWPHVTAFKRWQAIITFDGKRMREFDRDRKWLNKEGPPA